MIILTTYTIADYYVTGVNCIHGLHQREALLLKKSNTERKKSSLSVRKVLSFKAEWKRENESHSILTLKRVFFLPFFDLEKVT